MSPVREWLGGLLAREADRSADRAGFKGLQGAREYYSRLHPFPDAVQVAVRTSGAGEERAERYRAALRDFVRTQSSSGMMCAVDRGVQDGRS